MAGGKFSKPRPHRDEERQIEQAFRQVTGQQPANNDPLLNPPIPQPTPLREAPKASPNTVISEEAQMEQAFRQVSGQTPPPRTPQRPAPAPRPESFDLIPDDMEAFFDDLPPQQEQESSPDFIDKLMGIFESFTGPDSKKQKAILLGLCGAALLVIVCFIAIFFASSADPYDGKILNNVFLADIPVGGMTKNEAISAVKDATSRTYGSQDMVVDLSGTELRLPSREVNAKLDVKAAVNAAYKYGRGGTKAEQEQALALSKTQEYIIGLLPYLDLNEDYIEDTLAAYAEDSGSTLTQTTYGLEGAEPELSAEKFNEHAPAQTLVITLGTPGVGFDVQDVFEQVLDAYSLHTFLVTVEDIESVKEPDPIDLRKIYDEYYIAPKDATVNLQNFQTVPGSYGYGFDLEAAQKLLDEAQPGDVLRIPMTYIEPDILDGDAFFRDVLGSHKTRHTSNESRNTNLRLACEAINGTVLDPGETFSFNEVVGQRTSARGYKVAPVDASPYADTSLGGGISQVSSTLYYAAMLSDLSIISRTANKFAPEFIDYGMDAAVSWNYYDFSFRNNLSYPIQINAEVTGGYVRVEILGTEERDYYVLMDYTIAKTIDPKTEKKEFEHNNAEGYKDGDIVQEGVTGYSIKTYKIKYSKETNQQLSREYVSATDYLSADRIIAEVKPEETTAPTTVPTTVPPTTTTPPTTTAPPATTAPPTTTPTEAPTTAPTTLPTQPPTEAPVVTQPSTEAPSLPEEIIEEIVDQAEEG